MGKAKILVVEDEPQIAEAIQLNLQAAGFDVVIAYDGIEALRTFDQEAPDLATIDLMIPGVSGFRLVKLLKRTGSFPVVVVSALNPQEAEEATRAGADEYVTKPINFVELIRRIEFVLAKAEIAGKKA